MKVLIDNKIYNCTQIEMHETSDFKPSDFVVMEDVDKLKEEIKMLRRAFRNKVSAVTKNRLDAEIDFWQKVPVGGEYTDE